MPRIPADVTKEVTGGASGDLLGDLRRIQENQFRSSESMLQLQRQNAELQRSVDSLLHRLGREGVVGAADLKKDRPAAHLDLAVEQAELKLSSYGGPTESPTEEPPRKPTFFNKLRAAEDTRQLHKDVLTNLEDAELLGESQFLRQGMRIRIKAKRIVKHPVFELFVSAVIFANLVTQGLELEHSLLPEPKSEWPVGIEIAFLSWYVLEWLLRLVAIGPTNSFLDGWFLMDTAIILLNFAAFIVASSGDVGTFLAIRGVRLIRLGRSLRFTTRFRIMWHLLYGLLSSGQVLLATLALMVLAVYISACIGVELITRDADLAADPATSSVVSNSFGSLRLAMLTIIQFITLDSIHQIYIPLVVAKPNLIFYFLAVLLILPITLMNLVTAVLVENSLTQAQQEADYESKAKSDEMKKAVLHLLDIFKKLDNDKDGGLSRQELGALPETLIPHDLLAALCVDNLVELFDLLDVDQTGTIDRDEFVDGVLHMIVRDVPVETMRMMSMLQSVQHHLTSLDQTQRLLMLRTSGEDVSFL